MGPLSASNFLFKTGVTVKEQVSSPLSAQILDFCESELFPETTIEYSEVASSTSNNLDLSQLPRYQFGHQHQFDLNQIRRTADHNDGIPPYPFIGRTLPPVCEEDDCLSKFMRFNKTSTSPHMDSYLSPSLPVETSGIFNGSLFLGNHEFQLDFEGDNPDPDPFPYTSNQRQALSNESQHLVNGGGSEITSLESEPFRVTNNKLSTEERKEKIHRYMKKRNERNFSKKIKYACRKTLADSRPRVRGRFAKNDEFVRSNHEEDTDADVKSFHVVVKEEEEEENENMDQSSDIFAHISGLNSFKCNYPTIQSWI